jgi:hypothetical protein
MIDGPYIRGGESQEDTQKECYVTTGAGYSDVLQVKACQRVWTKPEAQRKA